VLASTVEIRLLADLPELIPAIGRMRWREWAESSGHTDVAWWVETTRREAGREGLPVTYVAVDGTGEALGAVGLGGFEEDQPHDRSPYVWGMVVRADERRGGVGRALLARLDALGYPQIWVVTGDPAVPFYRRCGYRRVERRRRANGRWDTVLRRDTGGVDLTVTRRSWHAVAELVLAGPQYRRTGTIRLRAVPGGFATTRAPALEVIGGDLVAGPTRLALDGRTCAELAAAAGVDVGAPADLYHDGSGVDADEPLRVDARAAAILGEAFTVGDAALRRFAPQESPVLWPEHFDVSVSVEEVNYGVSPGDGYLDEPYAYVAPWKPREGAVWNAPFGAVRSLHDLAGADEVAAFFAEGRDAASCR
jgi:GNAT superfamily N-acetyltransferase